MDLTQEASLDMEWLNQILESIPRASATDLVPILQKIQEAYGYLPAGVLMNVSNRTGIPASRIYGVATFYEQFHLEPHGRHTIRCCRGTACHVKGAERITETFEGELGIKRGSTTKDMLFTLEAVRCIGCCGLAPVLKVGEEIHGQMTKGGVPELLNFYQSAQG